MARAASPVARLSPSVAFRREIEAAVAEGVALDDMTLRLTLGDVNRIRRDPALAVEDVSFTGGVMRFLGVKVAPGGIDASALDRGGQIAD